MVPILRAELDTPWGLFAVEMAYAFSVQMFLRVGMRTVLQSFSVYLFSLLDGKVICGVTH
jgi:hypothetical protein